MLLVDFYNLLAVIGSSMAAGFTALDSAVLIDEPRVTLFGLALGFVILEFFISIINRFRGDPGAFEGEEEGSSTGRNPYAHKHGKIRYPRYHEEESALQATFGKRRRY